MLPANNAGANSPRTYHELASWWPLFSPPSHYTEEAVDLLSVLTTVTSPPPRTLLELGSGGGSLAFHLKQQLVLTLTDRSPQMLAVNRAVNPECEHVVGDMTSLRLGREFDAVLIHDAIMYATDSAQVLATIRTARQHCRPGGTVVILPDYVRETFAPTTSTGGEDAADGRGLRYLEWIWDPNSTDDTYEVMYAFLLRDRAGAVSVEGDRHRLGLFSRTTWLTWMNQEGFASRVRTDPWNRDIFVGLRV